MDVKNALKTRVSSARYLDCHTHQPAPTSVMAIPSLDLSNLAPADDWPEFYSLGLHPWSIGENSLTQIQQLQNRSGLLAIGECGLDHCIATPLTLQHTVFEAQLALAVVWNKPLIIHCVRAFASLLAVKKRYSTGRAWLIHGYQSSEQQLQELFKAGFVCSFGSSLLQPDSKTARYLRELPPENWLLESDNSSLGIDVIYGAAARILGWSEVQLHQQMIQNFQRIFLHD